MDAFGPQFVTSVLKSLLDDEAHAHQFDTRLPDEVDELV